MILGVILRFLYGKIQVRYYDFTIQVSKALSVSCQNRDFDNFGLHHVFLEIHFNQVRNQLKPINNSIKIQRTFYKSYDIMNKLLIIIHVDKISVKNK